MTCPANWYKSSYSGGQADCVEVAATSDVVLVRDSKDPAGPVLNVNTHEWQSFTESIQAAQFD